jgi:hypothetical protein
MPEEVMKLDQIPVHVDFVEVEIPPVVVALGAVCFVAILIGIVWLVLRSGRKNQADDDRPTG